MFLLPIWRYHIFPFLDKKSICKMFCTCSRFYKFPKKNKLWECIAKQHWVNCILPKKYLKVIKYFHSLADLSIYEKKIHRIHTNPTFKFKELTSLCMTDIYDVFYNHF